MSEQIEWETLTPEEKNTMSKNALETAKNKLDYKLYTDKLSRFFE